MSFCLSIFHIFSLSFSFSLTSFLSLSLSLSYSTLVSPSPLLQSYFLLFFSKELLKSPPNVPLISSHSFTGSRSPFRSYKIWLDGQLYWILWRNTFIKYQRRSSLRYNRWVNYHKYLCVEFHFICGSAWFFIVIYFHVLDFFLIVWLFDCLIDWYIN